MQLEFLHLSDYAASDPTGKVTIVGIFDVVWDGLGQTPIPFPGCYITAKFTASLAEGSAHPLEMRIVDDDNKPVIEPVKIELVLRPAGPGLPLTAQLIWGFAPGAIQVPRPGDYAIRFLHNLHLLGELTVHVRLLPTED